ncbi:hypothetical protein Tco_0925039 [Tanacetum coccineum]|uniref:Uncharacterized protein n=1 Tax=Tanacetum coccineum TaxID=301880 RepID=A0ABQ5D5Q9_9ASTR
MTQRLTLKLEAWLCRYATLHAIYNLVRIEMQGIAKVAIGGIRCGVCRQSGEERGTVLGVHLAGSRDRVLKNMYSVPGSNMKFGKWQERSLKVIHCIASIVLVVIQMGNVLCRSVELVDVIDHEMSSFLFQCAPSSLRQVLHVDILGNVFERRKKPG